MPVVLLFQIPYSVFQIIFKYTVLYFIRKIMTSFIAFVWDGIADKRQRPRRELLEQLRGMEIEMRDTGALKYTPQSRKGEDERHVMRVRGLAENYKNCSKAWRLKCANIELHSLLNTRVGV